MTTIDVDTSPLQAAREWRGIGLVAVAMNCGLPVAQAEALETGDPSAFDSIDEMIAAAVVYGASIGIGRDEAMALLDRTVGRSAPVVTVPDVAARPNDAFTGAVQERSSRIAQRTDVVSTPPIVAANVDPAERDSEHASIALVDEPAAPASLEVDFPDVPHGPTPEQAVAASGELHLDDTFGPDAPWERGGLSGELEAWVDDFDDDDEARYAEPARAGVLARTGSASHVALERIIGSDRADAVADRTRALSVRMRETARRGREQLRRSEHATLIVAIGAGAVLIALVVALGGALGGSDEPVPNPATERAPVEAPAAADTAAKGAAPATEAPVKPMLPPGRLSVDVFNAGSQKGKARTVADRLRGHGYRIGEVTNAKGSYAGATVIHPRDMAREARLLARRAGITTLQVAPGSTRRITVVVT
jgi:hypothetical protein